MNPLAAEIMVRAVLEDHARDATSLAELAQAEKLAAAIAARGAPTRHVRHALGHGLVRFGDWLAHDRCGVAGSPGVSDCEPTAA